MRQNTEVNLYGVDVEWVRDQLRTFVAETRAVNQSGAGFTTTRSAPACGRDRAIALAEVVNPILERLYPEWASENPSSSIDEFRTEREAAKRLLARLDTQAEVREAVGRLVSAVDRCGLTPAYLASGAGTVVNGSQARGGACSRQGCQLSPADEGEAP